VTRAGDRSRRHARRFERAYFFSVVVVDDESVAAAPLPEGAGVVVVVSLVVDFVSLLLLLEAGGVAGEADGAGAAGFSVTRSVFDSVQPAATLATSASAQNPLMTLFIVRLLLPCGGISDPTGIATAVPTVPGLTRCETFTTTAGGRAVRRPFRSPKENAPMKLEGSHDVPAPRQKVWDAFQDPELLRQAIPGCEKLEALGNGEYKATMKVGVGGVKGVFEGKVRLFDLKAPESYRMAVEGTGGPGFVRGETAVSLSDAEGGTRVSYTADVQIGGLIASVGQRMLGGVSRMMADKFFNRMSELLQAA
jgi:hypothetical protein